MSSNLVPSHLSFAFRGDSHDSCSWSLVTRLKSESTHLFISQQHQFQGKQLCGVTLFFRRQHHWIWSFGCAFDTASQILIGVLLNSLAVNDFKTEASENWSKKVPKALHAYAWKALLWWNSRTIRSLYEWNQWLKVCFDVPLCDENFWRQQWIVCLPSAQSAAMMCSEQNKSQHPHCLVRQPEIVQNS